MLLQRVTLLRVVTSRVVILRVFISRVVISRVVILKVFMFDDVAIEYATQKENHTSYPPSFNSLMDCRGIKS